MGPRAGLDGCGKSRPPPTEIRSPNRPARSQSLYRLSYPGPKHNSGKIVSGRSIYTFQKKKILNTQRDITICSEGFGERWRLDIWLAI